MKGVILDLDTLAADDLDVSHLMQQLDDWSIYPNTSPEQLEERVADADVVLSNKVKIGSSAIKSCTQLKLIAAMATGIDHIDIVSAKEHGVLVCNARNYSTTSVAQHTMALILALSTRLLDYDRAVVSGDWHRNHVFCLLDYPINELAGKTLGIIGYGHLAKKVEVMAKAFDMRIIVSESLNPLSSNNNGSRLPLEKLLALSDVVSLHCPLTEQTRNLMNAERLSLMKSTALLINTARGGVVNESDLADALKQGVFAGAALDVLSQEPPTSESILLQGDIPNLIVTPHSAWASHESRQRLIDQLASVISAFVDGGSVQQVI